MGDVLMNKIETAEIEVSEKKQWITPDATVEQVSEVTLGVQGGAGDGFNSCHS
jgi:hypothetical protein